MTRSLLASLLLLSAPAHAVQAVHEILSGEQIQPAVDAAAPGDILIFQVPFQYIASEANGTLVISKGLTLVGTRFECRPEDSVVVRDLPLGQTVIFREMDFRGFNGGLGAGEPFLRVENCQGIVSLEGCDFEAGSVPKTPLRIENSPAVLLSNCALQGHDGEEASTTVGPPTSGLVAFDSSVWISDSTIDGGDGGATDYQPGTGQSISIWQGQPALFLRDCDLFASSSAFTGGVGKAGFSISNMAPPPFEVITCYSGAAGGAAIAATSGTGPTVAVLENVQAAAGAQGPDTCTPDVQLPLGTPFTGFDQPGSKVQTSPFSASLALSPDSLPPSTSTTISVSAQPGAVALIAFAASAAQPIALFAGAHLWLAAPVAPVISLGPTDATGMATLAVQTSAIQGAGTLWLQAAAIEVLPGGPPSIRLTAPVSGTLFP